MGSTRLFYVISHERSGTHFVINTIFKNCINITTLHNMGEWFGPYNDFSQRFNHIDDFNKSIESLTGVIKSHCDFDLFNARYISLPVIYVVRDPRDVMVSWWHYLNNDVYYANNPSVSDNRSSTLSEFITKPVSDFFRFSYSLKGDFKNVIERWACHVAGWEKAPNMLIVKYEDLMSNFNNTLQNISKFLDVELKSNPEPVKFGEGLSHLPRKGIIGDWRNCCTVTDLHKIDVVIKKTGLDKFYFSSSIN